MSFDTARFDGHTTSKLLTREGGIDCRRSSEERCFVSERSAAKDRDLAVVGYETCGRIGATATTRSDGEKVGRGAG